MQHSKNRPGDVADGSFASVPSSPARVCFTPDSDRTADIGERRKVPEAAVSSCSKMRVQKPASLDHLVGGGEHR
jgi:hypothetical protein